ncbi:transcriptional regulator, GntR family [Malonomonas rubra DSM 5091]|uniref:Transcriptional regulator, GntR family n=1 Tax=Malonomonas rubra DSM 5091 TaxID=1122189 RepID=A0A1M6IK80_MALRU|nr:PLP-dependent aminotransferase family protein [Malonomonas rubra]SHJ34814.1 transcriptional regulator, GntR family [Malonomonas rubra DSM 5091]
MLAQSEQQQSRQPLYEEVAGRISFLIKQGTLRPGDRVPSIRKLSKQMQVSINTVKEAYSQLEDRRLLEARPQSGYYVRARLPELPTEPVLDRPTLSPAEVSMDNIYQLVMRDLLDPKLLQLGIAVPNPELLPIEKLNRMLTRETRRFALQSVSYDLPPGNLRLRQQVAQRLLLSGCTLSPEQIVTTSGCVEAVVLALQVLCKPGDVVAIESPVYFNFLQLIEDLGLKALEIPASPRGGISLEALEFALDRNRGEVKACIVITNFNNPLGSLMSDENKLKLVQLLERHKVPLIEDDIYGDLSFSDKRPSVAKSFDKTGNVLLCSSISKTLAPGYRVGWIAAGRYQEKIERSKMLANVATPTPTQLAIAEFLANGGYEHHLRSIRRVYTRQTAQMADAIGRCFPAGTRVSQPQGGFLLWVEMPEPIDSLKLYEQSKQVGITIAPGQLFSVEGKYRNCVRLNAAFWDPCVEAAIETLGRLAKSQLQIS